MITMIILCAVFPRCARENCTPIEITYRSAEGKNAERVCSGSYNYGAVRAVSEPGSRSIKKGTPSMTIVSSRSAKIFMVPALLLGVVAGLRSQLPGALLALAVRQGRLPRGQHIPLRWLSARWGLPAAVLAAGGELIGDKLPITPSRLAPAPLLGRLASGGAAGAAVADASGQSAITGAALGAIGAGIGSVAGYYARASLSAATGIASPILGVVEDIIGIGLGQLAISRAAVPSDE
jgi:uncharacterized membrane protein